MTSEHSFALKFVGMVGVFFCHCFPLVNYFGFLFVGIFFFVSGYGLCGRHRYDLRRVLRLALVVLAYAGFFWAVSGRVDMPYWWFLVVYSLLLLFMRVSGESLLRLCIFCSVLVVVFVLLEFDYVWWASFVAFPLGHWVRRRGAFPLLPFPFLAVGLALFLCGVNSHWVALFGFLSLLWRFRDRLLFLAPLGRLSTHFFFVHPLFLALFGVRDGVPIVKCCLQNGILFAFFSSIFWAFFLDFMRTLRPVVRGKFRGFQ